MELKTLLEELIKERFDIEIGGPNITVNTKKVSKVETPGYMALVKAIQTAYPNEMSQIHQKYDLNALDIIINKNQIIFHSDEGAVVNAGGKPYIIRDQNLLELLNKIK